MASTQSSTQADARFDGGVAPTVAKDRFTDIAEALARLVREIYTPVAPPRAGRQDRQRAHLSIIRGGGAWPADLGPRIGREQRSFGKRGTLARVAIAVCLGAAAISDWRSYGSPTPQAASIAQPADTAANESAAASADRQQIETTARDLVALHQTVEQLAAGQAQLAGFRLANCIECGPTPAAKAASRWASTTWPRDGPRTVAI